MSTLQTEMSRTRLTRPIRTRDDGSTFGTIAEAGAYMAALPDGVAMRNSWQHAARLILDSASAEPITAQIEGALFLECNLDLKSRQQPGAPPMTDAQRKLKPVDVGYFGKGVPDFKTIARLQEEFARKKLKSGLLSVETLEMHRRMNELDLKGDPKSRSESLELAKVLLPRLHFLVDDVDWDMS